MTNLKGAFLFFQHKLNTNHLPIIIAPIKMTHNLHLTAPLFLHALVEEKFVIT